MPRRTYSRSGGSLSQKASSMPRERHPHPASFRELNSRMGGTKGASEATFSRRDRPARIDATPPPTERNHPHA